MTEPLTKPATDPGEGLTAVIDRVRADVARLHAELFRYGLVVWTAGNVSGRVPGADLFVIKPSGVDYDQLTPDTMILCDLDGTVVEGSAGSELSPSSDTAAHAYVYRNMPEVGGVVHTHSTYATAWAARGEPIPCVITGMADEFGGEIPVGPFAIIGDDSIGRGIVATLSGHRSRAVLMRSHGVFTIGRNARDAVKAAVMTEDVARTIHIARQGGELATIAPDAIDALFARYQNVYGQPSKGAMHLCPHRTRSPTSRSGSSPEASISTGRRRSARSPGNPRRSRARLRQRRPSLSGSSGSRCSPSRMRSAGPCWRRTATTG